VHILLSNLQFSGIITSGTQPTLLGKPKLITLADALCNQKPSKLAQKFLVFEDWSKFEECQ